MAAFVNLRIPIERQKTGAARPVCSANLERGKMVSYQGRVEAVCVGRGDVLRKEPRETLTFELDGIVGDRHRGFERDSWDAGDKQPPGVRRRNERHFSAISPEELEQISSDMDLSETLSPATLGANLCISGIPQLSRLPKGTILKFPSGAELVVVEYNPPCSDMGQSIAEHYETRAGAAPALAAFLKAAQLSRGVVGVVDVGGEVRVGDRVDVKLYQHPKILARSA